MGKQANNAKKIDFNVNGQPVTIPDYNAVLDDNLRSFFKKKTALRLLVKHGLVTLPRIFG